jgi:hypothetical protein
MSKRRSSSLLATGAAAIAVAAGGGAALAAGDGSSASPTAFLESLAKHLGVSTEKLQEAAKAAATDQVDDALAAGDITQAQADELKARIQAGDGPLLGLRGFGFHGGPGPHHFADHLSAAATYLDLTEAQLREQLAAGKSLADVAEAQDKSVDGLKQAIVAGAKAQLDKAVDAGTLTSAQAAAMLERLDEHVDELVSGTFLRPRGGLGFRGDPAPALFDGPSI